MRQTSGPQSSSNSLDGQTLMTALSGWTGKILSNYSVMSNAVTTWTTMSIPMTSAKVPSLL